LARLPAKLALHVAGIFRLLILNHFAHQKIQQIAEGKEES
jgi:hypothetical protein